MEAGVRQVDVESLQRSPSCTPLGSDDEAELNAVEYARYIHLTVRLEEKFNPEQLLSQTCRVMETPLARARADLEDAHLLTAFMKIPPPARTHEKLSTTKEAGELLKVIYSTLTPEEVENLVSDSLTTRLPVQKLELPLLRSDHETDCCTLTRSIQAVTCAKIDPETLPLIPADTERDEGLEFPSEAHNYGAVVLQSIAAAKPDVQMRREILLHVHKALDRSWTDEDEASLWKALHTRDKVLQPITPPLSPQQQTTELFVLDSDDCQVPIGSTPSSRLSEDIAQIENATLDDDVVSCISSHAIDRMTGALSKSLTPNDFLKDAIEFDEPVTASVSRCDAVERLETPILPLEHFEEPDAVALIDLDPPTITSDSPLTTGSDALISSDLHHTIEKLAEDANKQAEQEQLLPADTKARLQLPLMDISIPAPSWSNLKSCREIMAQIMQDDPELWALKQWSVDRSVEKDMRWAPVLNAPSVSPQETLDGNLTFFEVFISQTEMEKVGNSIDYVWKRASLAILDDDDDEELSPRQAIPVKNEPEDDVKRVDEKGKALSRSLWAAGPVIASAANKRAMSDRPAVDDSTTLLAAGGHAGRHSKMLDNFLGLHGAKRQRTTSHTSNLGPQAEEGKPQFAEPEAVQEELPAATSPSIKLPERPPLSVISHMLHRKVRAGLERLIPGIKLVERDWSAHNTFIWLPNSAQRSECASSLADEVDIIISPTTGLILTTLVKVRQKPRPGASGLSLLKTSIQRASVRYERLIVLVSEANVYGDVVSPMSLNDATAFADFQCFLQDLDTEATAYFVGGADQTLASWTAAMVCRYCHEARQVQFAVAEREDEWELFLRRAGMNAFAAQAIVLLLQAPSDALPDQWPGWGMLPFVQMSQHQRVGMFEGVLGGRRVLDRVGARIDEVWPPANDPVPPGQGMFPMQAHGTNLLPGQELSHQSSWKFE